MLQENEIVALYPTRKNLPMQGRLALAWLVAGSAASLAGEPALERFEFSQVHMAVPIKLVFYVANEKIASLGAEAAFARFHALDGTMSDYNPASELRRLCDTAGEGKFVPVSDDLWRVLTRSAAISAESDGAFDVTIGPVTRLWRRARRRYELPTPEYLEPARTLVDYRLVRLDPRHQAVELAKAGMLLDLGGIAKGYAAGEALAVLRKFGINRAMVEAGGDIALGDPPPDRPGWRIALAPLEPNVPPSRYLWLSRTAVSTSGDLWQFVEINGRRYSHVIDPRTGVGLTDRSLVTIVGPDSMTADALGKALCVLSPEKGLRLIESRPGFAAIVRRMADGKIETRESARWKDLPPAQDP